MTEFKKEIIKILKEVEDKIINKLSLQEEKDRNITLADVDLLLGTARTINLIIDRLGEE